MRYRSSSSLTGKLLLWVTVITAATLIAVVGASTEVARRVLQRQILRSAETAAEEVALELFSASDPVELVQQPFWSSKLMRRLSMRGGIRGIDIQVNSRGRTSTLVASASEEPVEPLIALDDVALGTLVSRTADEHLEVVVRQALRGGDLAIRVSATTEVIGAFLMVVYRNAAWMGLAAWLLLVAMIGLVIRGTVTRPLRQVARALAAVGEGRLEQRVESVATTEVEPLVDAFNRMAERLAKTEHERRVLLHEVEQLNQQLQRRVEEATAALSGVQADLARRDRLAALGELVGTIAHEVGTPLNSVLAHLDLLREDLPPGAESRRLDLAMREIERVSAVIRRYLETTRGPSPRPLPIVVGQTLREALHIFEAQAATAGIALEVRADDVAVDTDPDLLGHIVRNLVSNSLAAVAAGGHIIVEGRLVDGTLELEVRDDGIGMDAATQERVFEPFFSARRDGTGTGLGMPIVRNAVQALGGRIEIESEPGQGTRVRVILPKRATGSHARPPAQPT